ncbi:MAG TPA: hypothetical protein VGS12_15115 [Caulobacteraceae bacterium]|nr:hypothetical protein [Caulobacteraceae bacterium]
MKTTVEIPDALYRRAKAHAALSGGRVRDLIEQGLRLVLTSEAPRARRLGDVARGARGIIDSGVPDLASNPAHLASFGGT